MDGSYVPTEAAITTDLRGAPYNFSLWDIHTGAQLVVFKGDRTSVRAKCLDIIDETHIVTAHDNVLNIWSIANKNRREQKLFLPHRPSVIAVTVCGNYLLAGMNESVTIWQLNTGNMICTLSRHYQTISVIKITPDNAYAIVGGEDGLVVVWSLAYVICRTRTNALSASLKTGPHEPKYTWHHHLSQVTDMHVSCEGRNGLCITVSCDCNVNIYNIATGRRVANLAMPQPIWSVTMDLSETRIFAGSQEGNIFQILLKSFAALCTDQTKQSASYSRFEGHNGKVNCLALSLDGTRLLSASLDGICRIWDACTFKLLSEIKHQGSLSNIKLMTIPKSLALRSLSGQEPPLIINQLKRTLCPAPKNVSIDVEDMFNDDYVFKCRNFKRLITNSPYEPSALPTVKSSLNNFNKDNPDTLPKGRNDLHHTTSDANAMKLKFSELYKFAAEKIFKDAADDTLSRFRPFVKSSAAQTPSPVSKSEQSKQGKNKSEVQSRSVDTNGTTKIKSRKRQRAEAQDSMVTLDDD